MLNFQIGKKYKRRDGSICTAIRFNIYQGQNGNTVSFDKGHDVWKNNGRITYNHEGPIDIIEEVKENEMKIEVGKWYKCSKGTHKAFIYHKLGEEAAVTRHYLGYVTALDGVFCKQDMWRENGEANHYDLHLIEEWKEPKSGVRYMNVYKLYSGKITSGLSETRRIADSHAISVTEPTTKRLACVRVEWKEGQFDE